MYLEIYVVKWKFWILMLPHTDDQAGKLALARSPMQVKIWLGEWKTGLGKWNFV